jgi:hypothetical protein
MDKCEFERDVNILGNLIISEADLLNSEDDDILNGMKILRSVKNILVGNNNDVEAIKDRLDDIDLKINEFNYNVKLMDQTLTEMLIEMKRA